jgi:A/G-specific adenine glycosylase
MKHRFADKVLAWFDVFGRHDLPWQKSLTPYPVWISEIMLQQTQVQTVIPYFNRFIARFPSINALAQADLDEVLSLWTGLGYYARARNLHKTARIISEFHQGEFPRSQQDLQQLPGIGRSTAGAISAICFHERVAILDGNVKRVISRAFAIGGWPGQRATAEQLWAQAEAVLPYERINAYTQAMMDLGATVCVGKAPLCDLCPVSDACQALKHQKISDYPGKKPKVSKPTRRTIMLVVKTRAGEIRLAQRPPEGIWGGLYSFPELNQEELDALAPQLPSPPRALETLKHSFTHFHLLIEPMLVEIEAIEDIPRIHHEAWLSEDNSEAFGLCRPAQKIIQTLLG